MHFRVTYEIVTDESAKHGDVAEHGYIDARDNRWDMASVNDIGRRHFNMSLREALAVCSPVEDNGRWWSELGGYVSGKQETRALHPHGVTPSSYRRICRLLNIR